VSFFFSGKEKKIVPNPDAQHVIMHGVHALKAYAPIRFF
jgi:hypothetical protein